MCVMCIISLIINVKMIEEYNISSINSYTTSYHKLTKSTKYTLQDKPQIPSINSHLFIKANINVNYLKMYMNSKDNQIEMPIFMLPMWSKFKNEIKMLLRKIFVGRLK